MAVHYKNAYFWLKIKTSKIPFSSSHIPIPCTKTDKLFLLRYCKECNLLMLNVDNFIIRHQTTTKTICYWHLSNQWKLLHHAYVPNGTNTLNVFRSSKQIKGNILSKSFLNSEMAIKVGRLIIPFLKERYKSLKLHWIAVKVYFDDESTTMLLKNRGLHKLISHMKELHMVTRLHIALQSINICTQVNITLSMIITHIQNLNNQISWKQ